MVRGAAGDERGRPSTPPPSSARVPAVWVPRGSRRWTPRCVSSWTLR